MLLPYGDNESVRNVFIYLQQKRDKNHPLKKYSITFFQSEIKLLSLNAEKMAHQMPKFGKLI